MSATTSPGEEASVEELVRRTAALARLEITPDEVHALGAQFTQVLAQFRGLAALDVTDVEPTTGATRLVDVLRADVPRASLPTDALLANAPRREGPFYAVPKVIGDEA